MLYSFLIIYASKIFIIFLEKQSFANKFKNNYSSSISKDINTIKDFKEFQTKEELFTLKTKNQIEYNELYTNENMMSKNESPFLGPFKTIQTEQEESFSPENKNILTDFFIQTTANNYENKKTFESQTYDNDVSNNHNASTNYLSVFYIYLIIYFV